MRNYLTGLKGFSGLTGCSILIFDGYDIHPVNPENPFNPVKRLSGCTPTLNSPKSEIRKISARPRDFSPCKCDAPVQVFSNFEF
jgi:hypothetical protein